MLFREKELNILLLEQQLDQEKSNQQEKLQVAQLQQEFEQMQIRHESSLAERDARIQSMTDKYKYNPQSDEFIKEALSVNSELM